MKPLLTLAALAILALLVGCAGGLQGMTPEQLAKMPGLSACSYYQGMYGKAGTVIVAADDVRKNATNKGKVIFGADCTVTVEVDTGVGAPAPAASGARP